MTGDWTPWEECPETKVLDRPAARTGNEEYQSNEEAEVRVIDLAGLMKEMSMGPRSYMVIFVDDWKSMI